MKLSPSCLLLALTASLLVTESPAEFKRELYHRQKHNGKGKGHGGYRGAGKGSWDDDRMMGKGSWDDDRMMGKGKGGWGKGKGSRSKSGSKGKSSGKGSESSDDDYYKAQRFTVVVKGTSTEQVTVIDGIEYLCYDGLQIFDLDSEELVGDAIDCLDVGEDPAFPLGYNVTARTEFNFLYWGTLVTETLVTVQPVIHGSSDFNYITGAISNSNSILYGNGHFKDAYGTVRRNGFLNIVFDDDTDATTLTFNEIYVIDIDKYQKYEPY